MGIFDGLLDIGSNPGADTSDTSTLSPFTLNFLKQKEGFQPQATWDYKQWSGGYGSRAQPGQTFTPQTAEAALVRDATPIDNWLSANVTQQLSPQQRAGLTSFGYNLGTGALQNLLPDINSGNWARVAERMQSYNHAGGQVNPGLVNRRAEEANLVSGQGSPMASGNQNQMATAAMFGLPVGFSLNPANVSAVPPQDDTAAYGNGPTTPAATGQSGGADRLIPPLERYNTLANAFTQAALGSNPNGWGTGLRALAELYLGKKYGNKYDQQQQAYTKALGQQIAGAVGDPQKALAIAAQSGSPQLQQAALQGILTPKPQAMVVKVGQDKYGSDIMKLMHPNGQLTNFDGTPYVEGQSGSGAQGTPGAAVDANGNLLTGEAFLKTLPPDMANMVRKMANGDVPYPTGAYAKSPMAQRLLQATQQYDPDYSEIKYHQMRDYLQNYTKGQISKDVLALNSAMQHTGQLYDQVDNLGNFSTPIVGQPLNYLKNLSYVNTGDTVNKFNTQKQTAINEWKKYYAGGHGSEAETERNLDLLSSASSPAQLKGAIATLVDLAKGKVDALEQARTNSMGPLYKGAPMLYPNNQAIAAKIEAAEAARNGQQSQSGAPLVSQRPSGKSDVQLLQEAQAAIKAGADTNAVNQQLAAWGVKQ